MEEHFLKVKVQFIFFFLSLLISNINNKDIYKKNSNKNINEKIYLQDDIKDKLLVNELKLGKVYKINLYALNTTSILFLKKETEYNILVHFYPLECKIYLTDSYDHEDKIYNISNYEYDAYYTLIEKDDTTSFKIKPLIYSLSSEIKNISCSLIINSVIIKDNNNVPELTLIEKEPVLFYFKDNVTRLNLIYIHNNNKNPIIVSFFIKEKTKFKIKYNDGKEEIEKFIYYKENILINSTSKSKYKIEITRIDQSNSTMIIKVSGNNSSSFYLQKNILNLGFIPKNELCQYYYMKVYKGQEGEILLNNKRLNGMLISQIKNKNENDDISKIKIFPKCKKNNSIKVRLNKDYLKFDEHNKKLSFHSSDTNICRDNCYLLITYYSEQHNYLNITGSEYTLLTRIWDEEDFISQIINIPLNEYIFGVIDNTTINIHYYSVYIPEKTENITIELHGENIISYAKKGIKKINTFKITNNTKQLNKNLEEKLIINLNKEELDLNTFKGQYISFAFKKGDDDKQFSYYYFRILQPNNKNIIIYPLDTNKDSLCETKSFDGSNACFFILKNEYQELSNKFIFYGHGQKNINYSIYFINNSDYYSIDLGTLNQSKHFERTNGYLKYFGNWTNSKFAVIKIMAKYKENIDFSSNFYDINEFNQTYDIYSYQLFYLNNSTNTSFYLSQNILNKYRVFINHIKGKGSLIFNESDVNKDNINLEGKKTYSFSIYKETKNISFLSEQNLVFNIKINYQKSYEFMDELDCQYNKRDFINKVNEDKFPIIYYIKDIKYEGIDVNLYFKFKNNIISINNFIITAGIIDYKDFKEIKEEDDVKNYLHSSFNGIYNPIINTGLIVFDKDLSKDIKQNENNTKHDDEYFFIIIDKNKDDNKISNFNLEINVIPKNDSETFLMENQYTQSYFNLLNKPFEIQKYFIDIESVGEEQFYLEFSSNYENTYIEFYNITKHNEKKIGGVKQYCLSISNETFDHYFTVKVNKSSSNKDPRFRASINLVYYLKDKKIDADSWINKVDISYKKSDTENALKKKINVLVKNIEDNKDSSISYFYYFRYINQKNLIENEILNTIAPIFSEKVYLIISKDNNQELSFDFKCEIEQKYSASFLIKIVKKKYERYYSIPFYFDTNRSFFEKNKIEIIILSFVIALIFVLLIFFLYSRKAKKKNIDLEDKVKAISFSAGIEEDSSKIKFSDKTTSNDDYENTFI